MQLLPGEGAPLPEHPYPGQSWREIRHDKTVTWLAFWKGAHLLRSGCVCLMPARACSNCPQTMRQLPRGSCLKAGIQVSWLPSAHRAGFL